MSTVDWRWKLGEAAERIRTRYARIGSKTGAPFLAIVYPPEAQAAVPGNTQFITGTITDAVGYIPHRTVKQLAGTTNIALPSSALLRWRKTMPRPHPAQARLPGSMYSTSGRFNAFVVIY